MTAKSKKKSVTELRQSQVDLSNLLFEQQESNITIEFLLVVAESDT